MVYLQLKKYLNHTIEFQERINFLFFQFLVVLKCSYFHHLSFQCLYKTKMLKQNFTDRLKDTRPKFS